MIILDTNIISELMKPLPNAQVIKWLNQQDNSRLFITTITIAEISYGIYTLPEGRRRSDLEQAFDQAINIAFKNRVLYFDTAAAHNYGKIMAKRKAMGQPLGVPDGQIAAIAYSQSYNLATRNNKDFLNCDIALTNPFDE